MIGEFGIGFFFFRGGGGGGGGIVCSRDFFV